MAKRKGNPVVGGIIVVVLIIIVIAVVSGSGKSKTTVSPTVQSATPEDSNHVAVITKWTNTGTKAQAVICDIIVNDSAGTQIGDAVDGPADKVQPGQTITIRSLIKTSVDTSNLGQVTFSGCSQQ